MEEIRQACDSGEFDEAKPHVIRGDLRKLLDEGRRPLVQVNGHAIVGRLLGMDDAGRAGLLVEMMGASRVARADARDLVLMPEPE